MVFNRKEGFFLDLGSEGAQPAKVAIKPPTKAATGAKQAAGPATAAAPATASAAVATAAGETAAPAPTASTDTSGVLTTAEAIAAELRAAQEALPPPSLRTFAPDNLNPANAVPTRRRRAGANLAGFKGIAKSLFGG